MEEYLVSVRALLGVLGHRVLDPYSQPVRPAAPSQSTSPTSPPLIKNTSDEVVPNDIAPAHFTLHIGGITATAVRTDEGLVVLQGSEAAATVQTSLSGGYRALRERLMASGTLVQSNGNLNLTKDQLFSSPSQAAAVLVGYSINGRDAWRLDDGTTYGTYEQRISADLLKQLEESN
jgi:hypothetical protein